MNMSEMWRRLQFFFRRDRNLAELEEEMRLHLELRSRQIAEGGEPDPLMHARRRFGDPTRLAERSRAEWGWLGIEKALDDLKYAVRGIIRSPALSSGIILAFALGIGANSTMYETVERLLLRPPPHIEDPYGVRRLLVHRQILGEARHTPTIAYADYEDFARTSGFSHVSPHAMRSVTLGQGETAAPAKAVLVGATYWSLLGVHPALGRFFTPQEDAIGARPTAVLSWSRWQSDYGGRVDAIGRTVDFGHGEYTIIGVTPKGFTGINLQPVDLFLPFMVAGVHLNGSDIWTRHRGSYWLQAIGRLAPGVTAEMAEAEATAHHRSGRAESADDPTYDSNARVVAAPVLAAQGPNVPSEVAVARWLLGIAVIVLVIACLNVANLTLARLLRQRREMSIRLALGISRRRLIAQVVIEGVVLGVLGGAAALLLAAWGGTFLQKSLLPDIDWSGGPAWSLLLVILAFSLFAGLVSTLGPAIQATRGGLSDGLRTASGGITRSSARMRETFFILQAALSVPLLIGAGLFIRSLSGIHTADFGLDVWDVAYVQPMFEQPLSTADERFLYYETAVERVRHMPGVNAAAAANSAPFGSTYSGELRAEDADSIPSSGTGRPTFNSVDNDYFRVLGIGVERGRLFDERDTGSSQRVAIVNAAMAHALWPNHNAIGKCLFIGGGEPPCTEIVGVVENARRAGLLVEADEYQYYVPLQQRQLERPPYALLVRITGDMRPVLPAVKRVLLGDPRVRWVEAMPLEDKISGELRQWRLGATMFTLFGALALTVAAIGLYSVLAFDVAQRIREMGLRSALGATRASIATLILARAMRITAVGIGIGVVVALLLTPRLGAMLYRVQPRDPLTFLIVVAAMALIALAAAILPARRAACMDPNSALRAE